MTIEPTTPDSALDAPAELREATPQEETPHVVRAPIVGETAADLPAATSPAVAAAPVPPAPLAPGFANPYPVSYAPQPAPRNGIAIAAMILGIVAIAVGIWALAPIAGYAAAALGLPIAVAAAVCGHIGFARGKRLGAGRGQGLTGIILGYVTLAMVAFGTAAWTLLFLVGATL